MAVLRRIQEAGGLAPVPSQRGDTASSSSASTLSSAAVSAAADVVTPSTSTSTSTSSSTASSAAKHQIQTGQAAEVIAAPAVEINADASKALVDAMMQSQD